MKFLVLDLVPASYFSVQLGIIIWQYILVSLRGAEHYLGDGSFSIQQSREETKLHLEYKCEIMS